MFKSLKFLNEGFDRRYLKEEVEEELFHNDNGTDYVIVERSKSGQNALLRTRDSKKWIIAWNCPKSNEGSWGQGHYFFDEQDARDLWEKKYINESVVGNAKNWLIDKEGKTPKEAERIINNSSPEEIEEIALRYTKKNKKKANEDWNIEDQIDAPESIGKLNKGDKFKNRKGIVITITDPTKDGRIQYCVGDECRSGSEKSIQQMLYRNNYTRMSSKNESVNNESKTNELPYVKWVKKVDDGSWVMWGGSDSPDLDKDFLYRINRPKHPNPDYNTENQYVAAMVLPVGKSPYEKNEALDDQGVERYGVNGKWWYFTTHGVQPGSVPKGIKILDIKEGKNKKGTRGTFFVSDRVLNTSELDRYDIKEEVPVDESLDEDIDGSDYLKELKEKQKAISDKLEEIRHKHHYRGFTQDYMYKSYLKQLAQVEKDIAKIEASANNEEVLTTAKVTNAIKKASGLETLKTRTSSVRGYRPVTGGSFEVQPTYRGFDVYFYNNYDKIPQIIDELTKQGFRISDQSDRYFYVEKNKSLTPTTDESLNEDLDRKIRKKGKVTVLKKVIYSTIPEELEHSDDFNSRQDVTDYFSNKLFSIKNGNIYLNPGTYDYVVRREPNVAFNFVIDGKEYPYIDWDENLSNFRFDESLNEDSLDDHGISKYTVIAISKFFPNEKFKMRTEDGIKTFFGRDLLYYFDYDTLLSITDNNVIVNRDESLNEDLDEQVKKICLMSEGRILIFPDSESWESIMDKYYENYDKGMYQALVSLILDPGENITSNKGTILNDKMLDKVEQIEIFSFNPNYYMYDPEKTSVKELFYDFKKNLSHRLGVSVRYVGNEDELEESLTEDTVKQNGKWVNKGKEGTHGKFATKKAADAQRRAIWVNWDK